jgi:hypothetical protein
VKNSINITFLTFILLCGMLLPFDSQASHRTSSSLRTKIRALDDDRVENVPVPILFGLTPDNIWPSFGDPRPGGRTHEGIDLIAPKGAPIASPTEAVVLRKDTGDSAGKYVYTANPGGETFAYMHLDEFADIDVGDVLRKGDLIGYVGNTGNATETLHHLHFEIRDGEALDPYPRIKSIFPLADKIRYLAQILENESTEDAALRAEYIVRNYRRELLLAQTYAIALPPLVSQLLVTLPAATPGTGPQVSSGDLTIGSQGPAVVALQLFLIGQEIGSAVGLMPDGVFGPATQRALSEFQMAVGITPTTGYYGPKTRAYIIENNL